MNCPTCGQKVGYYNMPAEFEEAKRRVLEIVDRFYLTMQLVENGVYEGGSAKAILDLHKSGS